MKKHLIDIMIEMSATIIAGVLAFITALFSWLVIDFYSAIWYIISRKRGKTMHKKNIFDLFNEQHPEPAKDPAPGNVVKSADVQPDIVVTETETEIVTETASEETAEENAEETAEGSDV